VRDVRGVGIGLRGILADHVQRGELLRLHGVDHLREMPAILRNDVAAPRLLEFRSMLRLLDVLESRQLVRERPHVSAALNVVLSAQRIASAAVPSDVTREQREIDQRKTLSTALWCSVMPSVQQIIARSAFA
jgi:hypothetical protein